MQLAPVPTRPRTALPTSPPSAPRALLPAFAPAPDVPGPELPGIPPNNPALPLPPSLAKLARIAAAAPAIHAFRPGSAPSTIHNAHYTNTRSQLAFALAGPYNSVEGDIRLRGGVAMMQHDGHGASDLTFEQWALLASRAGKHLRVDVKEAAALAPIVATLQRLGIDPGRITFNVAALAPWTPANQSIATLRALHASFPTSWITLNLPLPLGPGFVLAARAARELGRERIGVAIMPELVHAGDIAMLRRSFAAVNAWNLPMLHDIDVVAVTAHLRAIGVNGMVDLRDRRDPLAND